MNKNSKENYNELAKSISELFGNILNSVNVQGTESFKDLLNTYFTPNNDEETVDTHKNEVEETQPESVNLDDKDVIIKENDKIKCTKVLNLSYQISFDEMYVDNKLDKFTVKLPSKITDILDTYIFKIYSSDASCSKSEIIISFENVTFGYKWNFQNETYELVYTGNNNISDLQKCEEVIGYYDKDNKTLCFYHEQIKDDDVTSKCFDSTSEIKSNEITAKTLYEKCNAKKADAIAKYKTALKSVVDDIFANDKYEMYSDDYNNVTSIIFPVSKLKFVKNNELFGRQSVLLLYKIFTRVNIENFLKDTYKFPEVTVGVDKSGENIMDNLEESYIKCKLV